MQLSQFVNTFTYAYKLDVNSHNWHNFKDGWSLYTDISKEAARMGINFGPSGAFKLFDNSAFTLCPTYPSKLVFPKAMSQKQIEGCSEFRTK